MPNAIVGAGKIYMMPFTGTIPTDATLEVEDNLMGVTTGGCTITYKPTVKTEKDDLGQTVISFVSEEELTMKFGLFGWHTENLQKIAGTGEFEDDTVTHVRTLKVGGRGAAGLDMYVVRFVHKSDNIRVTIVGCNEAGFELAFATEDAIKYEPEFKALAHDTDGTLVIIEEKYTAA